MKEVNESVFLITGATDGLGKQVAHDIAEQEGTLILHGRNKEKGESTIRNIQDETGNNNLRYYNADFSSLEEVYQMSQKIKTEVNRLDVLINNAGIGFGGPGSGREESRDGLELRFQVNYLAGFLLTLELLPLLRKSDQPRIVNVASGAQDPIDFDDVMLEKNYSGNRAYGQSKLAQIMFTTVFARRENDSGITVNALHPATYMDTNMVREAGISPANSVEKGADAVEYLATSSELDEVTGEYFNRTRKSRANGQASDKNARECLWNLSEELVQPFQTG